MGKGKRRTPNAELLRRRFVGRPLRLPRFSEIAQRFSAGKPGIRKLMSPEGTEDSVVLSGLDNWGRGGPSAKALGYDQQRKREALVASLDADESS